MIETVEREKRSAKRTGDFDLDSLTVGELTALRDAAEAKRQEKLESATLDVLEEARSKLAEMGLSLENVLAQTRPVHKAKRGGAGEKVPVKYRSPKGEEWSGRGRMPRWLAEAEKNGSDRREFLVHRA